MKTINGQRFLTVHAEAEEIHKIKYSTPPRVNVLNTTDGIVKISSTDVFADDGTSGTYITIPSGAAANDICMPFDSIYVKASESGDIVIERCR